MFKKTKSAYRHNIFLIYIYIYIYNIGNIYLFWVECFNILYVDLRLELKYTKEV